MLNIKSKSTAVQKKKKPRANSRTTPVSRLDSAQSYVFPAELQVTDKSGSFTLKVLELREPWRLEYRRWLVGVQINVRWDWMIAGQWACPLNHRNMGLALTVDSREFWQPSWEVFYASPCCLQMEANVSYFWVVCCIISPHAFRKKKISFQYKT